MTHLQWQTKVTLNLLTSKDIVDAEGLVARANRNLRDRVLDGALAPCVDVINIEVGGSRRVADSQSDSRPGGQFDKNNPVDLLGLATEVYDSVNLSVESLEHDDMVGSDLAYLLGAILNNTDCEWPYDRAFLRILRDNFSPRHPVWNYARAEPEKPQTRIVRYFRCWPGGSWDSADIEIPADTPDDDASLEAAIRTAYHKLPPGVGSPPVRIGLWKSRI